MKDEEVMAVLLKICGKNLEKKENENDFESLDAFDEGKLHCTL